MKKLIPTLILALTGIIIWSCNKELEIQDVFDFNFETTTVETLYKDDIADVDFLITPERVVDGTTYTFSFSFGTTTGATISDEGYFEGAEGVVISENEEYTFNEFSETLRFKAQEIGTAVVDVEIKDSNGIVKTETLTFEVIYSPFTFLVSPESPLMPINFEGNLNVNIVRSAETSSDGTLDFDVEYYNEIGEGTLYIDGNIVAENTVFNLEQGSSTIQYVASTLGEHKLAFSAVAPDGATRDTETIFNVEHLDFVIDASTASTTVNANDSMPITLNFVENPLDDTVTYEVKHYFEVGSGGVYDNASTLMNPNNFSPITEGTYSLGFQSETLGLNRIIFVVKDSNGNEKEDFIEINVENIPFTFTGTPTDLLIPINTSTIFNFTINPDGTADGINYDLSFQQIDGTGIVTDHLGNNLIAGATVSVPNSTPFTFDYIPTTTGPHKLLFTVTDDFGQTMESEINIIAEHNEVLFQVTPSATNLFLNQLIDLSFIITELNPTNGTSYEMNYYSTGGTGELTNNGNILFPGTFSPVSTGNFTYQYKGTNTGNQDLVFQLRDSNNQIIERTLSLSVSNGDFSFGATGTPITIFVGETANINLALQQTYSDGSITYEASYVFNSGSSDILDQFNAPLNAGVYSPINVGQTTWTFIPQQEGAVQIEITARDSNNNVHVATVTLNVEDRDFDFTATAGVSTSLINREAPFSVNFVDVTGLPDTYSVFYVSNKNGEIHYNGGIYTPGTPITFLDGVSNLTYVPLEDGNHNLQFTATSTSSNITHVDNLTFDITKPEFTISAISSVSDVILNDVAIITVSISETDTPAYNDIYSLVFESSQNGTIEYNGNTYAPGDEITGLAPGNYALNYTGTTTGNHNLDFTVTNSLSDTETAGTNLSVEIPVFNITASESPSILYTGQTGIINVSISDNGDPINQYEYRYQYLSNTGTMTEGGTDINENLWLPVPSNNFQLDFIPTFSGTADVRVFARNILDTSQEQFDGASFDVIDSDFTFSVVSPNSNVDVYEDAPLIFSLIPEGDPSITYEMFFTSSLNGAEVTIGGNTYTSGDLFTITPGTFTGNLSSILVGDLDVSFFVTASNNVAKDDSVSITVNKIQAINQAFYARTTSNQNDCGGGDCDYDFHYWFGYNPTPGTNPDVNWVQYRLVWQNGDTYQADFNTVPQWTLNSGLILYKFRYIHDREFDQVPNYTGTILSVIFTDQNGNESIEYVSQATTL